MATMLLSIQEIQSLLVTIGRQGLGIKVVGVDIDDNRVEVSIERPSVMPWALPTYPPRSLKSLGSAAVRVEKRLWIIDVDTSVGTITVAIESTQQPSIAPAPAQQPTTPAPAAQPIRVRPVPMAPVPAPAVVPVALPTPAMPAVTPQSPATAVVAPTVPVPAPAPAPAPVVQPAAPAAVPTPQRGNWLQRGITWITGG